MSTEPAAGLTVGVDPFAQRRAGILLHPTSLPARHGIGDLGPSARTFVEWLTGAGMKVALVERDVVDPVLLDLADAIGVRDDALQRVAGVLRQAQVSTPSDWPGVADGRPGSP